MSSTTDLASTGAALFPWLSLRHRERASRSLSPRFIRAADVAGSQIRELGRDLDLRWREHPKEVSRQLAARLPELQPYDLAGARIEFSEAYVGLLSHGVARVIVLEANPSDVGLGVVVPVDSHERRLASPPYGHNSRNLRIVAVRMLVGDNETTSGDEPARPPLVASPPAVTLQQRRLDITTREAELLRLVERVKRPANGCGFCRHKPAA